jgi:hypothetical protein
MPDVCTAKEAITLLTAVHRLVQEQANKRWASLVTSFDQIRREWGELKKRRYIKERNHAPRHNIFRLLGLERSEIWLHSPILCDLLDPYGTHGQGALFLRTFLELLAQRYHLPLKQILPHVADPVNPHEWIVLPERQKIDITIRSKRADLVIFIENKIDAQEQNDQLRRYRELMEKEKYSTRLLIFLSPRKYGPPQTGIPDIHLTYENDIWRWLSAIAPHLHPIHLRGALQQYCRVIQNMDREDNMANRNQELIDVLKQQENLLCALEISEAIEDVKNDLRRSFWEQVDADLRKGLDQTGLALTG